ncbi:MAG: hypothetical protein F9K35_03255 [Burkholderiaceae bacterium]|nr:MAG: hypothetical protein F9K35_03255 [Burkholderiaceae bacterium]
MPVAAQINGRLYAIEADHLNTPRRLTDRQGQVAWQWLITGFGETPPTTGAEGYAQPGATGLQSYAEPVPFELRYPGQQWDAETNLAYNLHRYYDASTGRYVQADPIGLEGGWNRFGYVEGDPLGDVDPEGLQSNGNLFSPFIPPDPYAPPPKPNPLDRCVIKCTAKKVLNSVIVAGALGGAGYAAVIAGLVPVGAVIVGVYVYQQYGSYYTLIKYAYTINDCIKKCKEEICEQ